MDVSTPVDTVDLTEAVVADECIVGGVDVKIVVFFVVCKQTKLCE